MELVTIVNMERDYSGSIVNLLLRTYNAEYRLMQVPASRFIETMDGDSYLEAKRRILTHKNEREAALWELCGAGELSFKIGKKTYKLKGVI